MYHRAGIDFITRDLVDTALRPPGSGGEILAAILNHRLALCRYCTWLAPATLGNICGGVTLVTLLESGQVKGGEEQGYYH